MSGRTPAEVVVLVAAALISDDHVLILHRSAVETGWSGYWEIPGGKRNLNETSLAALARELHEETGVVLPQDALPCHVFDYCSELSSPAVLDRTQVTFAARLRGRRPRVRLSKEHDSYDWAPLSSLADVSPMTPETLAAIRAAGHLLGAIDK